MYCRRLVSIVQLTMASFVLSRPESAGETSVLVNERVFCGRAMYRRRVVVMVQLIMHGWKAQEKLLCFLVIDAFG